jgi:hypothetical protein
MIAGVHAVSRNECIDYYYLIDAMDGFIEVAAVFK